MDFKIAFSGVGVKYTQKEKEAVLSAMESSETLTQGQYQSTFENEFSKYVNKKNCFARIFESYE